MTAEPRVRRRLSTEGLSPGYFALVMATGIVSIGCGQRDWGAVSVALLGVAGVAYVALVGLNAHRLLRHRAAMVADLRDARTAFGFFTFVAATDVLAVGIAGHGAVVIGAVLLGVAGTVWAVLGYAIPGIAVLGGAERPIIRAANGSWLVWVVASQSVAVAAATLEPHFPASRQAMAIVAVLSWSVGLMLYAGTAVFVALRLVAYTLDPHELDPAYWIAMGAVAITVVAGARIVEMDSAPMVDAVRGLVAGLAVLMWCFATWLIPALVGAGIWRHLVHRVPLHYAPNWWSIVFPLGMYAVAGMYLGRADHLPIVEGIGALWIWVAVAAWLVTFTAMVVSWIGPRRRSP
ncbi:tellurite resistance/C4-dicarboxylate transporter family protein [Raineyella fluvialis]|uniref:Tellurite resistance protein permease n=1 Tax=Raineyella fluvialis TaxID=2662261 RepID=A0A5Q2FAU8_9ACTN|nr:tellurite resistance/C4-dicarboxylate transporter family protein [Raineyella fluvialis]QGF24130.1 tellurite resistance protein permease [Raineyella fluvialis]